MWTINFPDKFGRTVISGLIKNINTKLFETSFLTATFRGDSDINGGYEFSFQLPDNIQFLTINYYDNYSFLQLLPESEEKKYANYNKTGYGQTELNASGLLTGRRIYTTTQPYSHNIEVNYYDKQGRLVEKHTSNHLGGMEDNFIAYTFSGKPLQTLHIHTAFDKSPVSEIYRYEYDHADRPTKTFYKLNDFDEILLSEQSYDELCRLTRKKINNGNYAIDYNYNIRNWKEQISSSLFSETINYTKSTNGNNSYNGNISSIETTVRSATNISLTTKWNITYQYDGLNRLISSNYTPSGNPIQPYRADYSTSYTYDLNGNITSLTRKGPRIMLQENGSPIFVDYGDIDKLTLTLDGNHLQCVADEEGEIVFGNVFDFNDKYNDEIEYSYDSNGNLTSDLNREIELITYDSSNQPASISFKNGASTIYSYNADKQKLRTVYNTPQAAIAPTTENDTIFKHQNTNIQSNINSPQFYRDYCGNIIYKDGKLERILTECGYIEPNGQNGQFKFRYFLHDHLGNIRTVIDEQNTVLECNNYYPFGTPQGSSLNSQPYKFGGKELDRMNGLDIYDFEARQYDSLLGRFTTLDPKCEKSYDISPYAYCLGNPILLIDPTGEIPFDTLWDLGNVIYDIGSAVINHINGDHEAAKSNWVDFGLDMAAMVTPYFPAGTSKVTRATKSSLPPVKVSPKMKNAERIKEGLEFERKALSDNIKAGKKVKPQIMLIPLNEKGNVKGNRTRVDQLILNDDGTFTGIETKLTKETKMTKGQQAAFEHSKTGSGEFIIATDIPEWGIQKNSTIKIDYQFLYKYP